MERKHIRNVSDLYTDKDLYSSPDMFSPPSERRDHVIRFELTQGCSWGRCTFCGGFDGVRYREKSIGEYRDHVNQVWSSIGGGSSLASKLKRVFIGGGDGFGVEFEKLYEALRYTVKEFRENVGNLPSRVSMYARTKDILSKGDHELYSLKGKSYGRDRNGSQLDLVYWGVESGSTKVLEYVNKGCNGKDVLEAGKKLRNSPINASVMIMPGLGGIKYYKDHVRGTAKALSEIKPQFITFMGVNPSLLSPYSQRMQEEVKAGTNRPLRKKELADQMFEIIKKMSVFPTKIGCFDSSIDQVGYNPLSFGTVTIPFYFDRSDKKERCKIVREMAERN